MEITEVVGKTAESMSARRVFSEPISKDGVTVVLAASVRGGGGGGQGQAQGEGEKGQNTGTGFGFMARPAGAFVIREGQVTWRPAFNLNRIIFGGQLVLGSAIWLARAIIVRRRMRMGRMARLFARSHAH